MLTLKLEYADNLAVDDIRLNPVVSVGYTGTILSRYNDNTWAFPVSRSRPDSRMNVFWPDKADDAKQLAFLRLTHGNPIGATRAFRNCYTLAALSDFCNARCVKLRELSHYPKVVIDFCSQNVSGRQRPYRDRLSNIISIARTALGMNDNLGWLFLNAEQIEELSNIDTLASKQHPVIPNRIFQSIDDAAQDILKNYESVAGQLDDVLAVYTIAPDHERVSGGLAQWSLLLNSHFVLYEQFERYTEKSRNPIVTYFNVVRAAAFWVIASGSCARRSEILDLRIGCLRQEQIGGNVAHLMTGPTTKTQDNPNAIWVTAPRVETAVRALERVLKTYKTHHHNPPKLTDKLFQIMELNFGRKLRVGHVRKGKLKHGDASKHSYLEKLCNHADVLVRQEDWREAKMLTPDLNEEKFAVGKPWALSPHQIRRTLLVRAAASGLISSDSLSFQAKHQTWQMTAYYCRNYWHLTASNAGIAVVAGTRESDALEFTKIYVDSLNKVREQVASSHRFFSPYGDAHKQAVVEATPLVSLHDIRRLTQIGVLKGNTLGLCAQSDYCEWQKAVTVRGCMTKIDGKPCGNVIIDSSRRAALIALRETTRYELEELTARDVFALEQKGADFDAINKAIEFVDQHLNKHA